MSPKYSMTVSFGNPPTVQQVRELGEAIGSSGFDYLYAQDAYIENLRIDQIEAYWLDPDTNIDLDKIGDTLDSLPDGETYARVKSLHLDAGQIKLDEYVYYSPGYDPNTKRRNFTATPTTPYDVGDLWHDASVVKTCTTARASGAYVAADWTATTLDAIAEGITYQRVKSAALTADGLVILDQVVAGTYGLVNSTAISAGKIKLSSDGLDTSLGYGLVASTDISAGHIKLDTVEEGTYGLVKSTDISAGHIKLDTVEEGTYGLVKSTNISAGNIKLIVNQDLGAQGMEIVTASTGNRAKLDSAGLKLYYGATLLGNFACSDTLLNIYAANNKILGLRHYNADIKIYSDSANIGIIPATDNRTELGRSSYRYKWLYAVTVYQGDSVFSNDWKLTETEDSKGIRLLRPDGSVAQEWR